MIHLRRRYEIVHPQEQPCSIFCFTCRNYSFCSENPTPPPPSKPRAITKPKIDKVEILPETKTQTIKTPASGFGKIPLAFEANQGQSNSSAKFLLHRSGYGFLFDSNEIVLSMSKESPSSKSVSRKKQIIQKPSVGIISSIKMKLLGANEQTPVSGIDKLPGTKNYFMGNDPKKWQTNIPTYRKVKYTSVYEGIDMIFYGNQRELEYDFVVSPNANPQSIRLEFQGANKIHLDRNKDLVITTKTGKIVHRKPRIYQEKEGQKQLIEGEFLLQSKNQISFKVGEYDHTKPLIIDPVLAFSTYLGGAGDDIGNSIAIDQTGSSYITGNTNLTGVAPFQTPLATPACQTCTNGFVTKFDPTGTVLLYSTYFGGSLGTVSNGIAVDGSGNAYITGVTSSADFPIVGNSVQPSITATGPQNGDAFVIKLNPNGSGLVYSTFLGGSRVDVGTAIAVDATGKAYITGTSNSTEDFPGTTPRTSIGLTIPLQFGTHTAFVAKLSEDASSLIYSVRYGSSQGTTTAAAIALDKAGNAYIAGTHDGSYGYLSVTHELPTTPGSLIEKRTNEYQVSEGFVAKISRAGGLIYGTYLGGDLYDEARGIAVDSDGNAYVAGMTSSNNFPITPNAFQNKLADEISTNNRPFNQGFITKINPSGSGLIYSTYLRGTQCNAIAIDQNGHAFVTGRANSDLQIEDAIQPNVNFYVDAFVAELDTAGESLLYSTFLGGSGSNEEGRGIAVDELGNAYITGKTDSLNFPTTDLPVLAAASPLDTGANPRAARAERVSTEAVLQPSKGGGRDGFVAKIAKCAHRKMVRPASEHIKQTIGVDATAVVWEMDVSVSDDEGLVIKNVKLGKSAGGVLAPNVKQRYMAAKMSIPYFSLETITLDNNNVAYTTTYPRAVLSPDVIPNSSGAKSILVDYQTKVTSHNLVVEAKYAITNIPPGSTNCLHITQRYEFQEAEIGCEPSEVLTCARFFPKVKYEWVGKFAPIKVNIPERLHFQVNGFSSNTAGVFKDCDDLPFITCFPNAIFDKKENPVDNEFITRVISLGKPTIPINGGRINSFDNYHQRNGKGGIDEPITNLSFAGCPECAHIHWRWTAFEGAKFGNGQLLIPKSSPQNVDIALAQYKLGEDKLPLTGIGNIIGSDPTDGSDIVFYYSASSNAREDRFFEHGGFYRVPNRTDDKVSLNGGAIQLILAYVYADGNSSATSINPGTAGTLPAGSVDPKL